MPVITMLSPKGGVGKTTTALLLAGQLADDGAEVILIDADPNFPLTRWASLGGKPDNIEVIQQIDEDEIVQTIDAARKRAPFVIVDLEGKATARSTNALMLSTLALVPIQGSAIDAAEAVRAFKSIRNAATARGRALLHAAVLTRTPASERLWSKHLKGVAQNLKDAEIPIVATALAERGAYRDLFSLGGTLASMTNANVASLEQARANSRAFASDVLEILQSEKAK